MNPEGNVPVTARLKNPVFLNQLPDHCWTQFSVPIIKSVISLNNGESDYRKVDERIPIPYFGDTSSDNSFQ
jgi:hypothetical protein